MVKYVDDSLMIEIGENLKMWYIGELAGALPTYPPISLRDVSFLRKQ
jgi:hypothetical protein